jgi:hypothetical protein
MTSFNPDMQNEKLAAILLVIVIVGSISVFLTVTYGEDILNTLSGKKTGEKIIALGDCVDVNYIGRYASNNTIFDSSYAYPTNKTGGTPLNIFVTLNQSEYPPDGYENYTFGIKGFIEGLVGLKEGDSKTIGPIPPEDAYGVYPKVGDVITISDPSFGKEVKIQFANITNNGTTTLFVLRDSSYSLGEIYPLYPSWENATVITKINETNMWIYTTPPEDKRENFTWIYVDSLTEAIYWENASSVTSINDTEIVVTHNPEIDATMYVYDTSYGSSTAYTVVSLTDEKINVSYIDETTGNMLYDEFDRTITIVRNESQNITFTYTTPDMEYLLSVIKYYVPNLTFSVNKLADESLIFEVQIVKVYKTS